jgi:hypothetical protein
MAPELAASRSRPDGHRVLRGSKPKDVLKQEISTRDEPRGVDPLNFCGLRRQELLYPPENPEVCGVAAEASELDRFGRSS